jgi:hypothetical protein
MNGEITCIDLPELEVTLVALQSVGAESFGGLYCKKPAIALDNAREPCGRRFIEKSSWGARCPKR